MAFPGDEKGIDKRFENLKYVETESNHVSEASRAEGPLKRQLKNRHIAMIRSVLSQVSVPLAYASTALVVCAQGPSCCLLSPMSSFAGVIGTGLFLGTGGALRSAGPVGLLLGYMIVGTVCYSVMVQYFAILSKLSYLIRLP
jgi:amino acid permease